MPQAILERSKMLAADALGRISGGGSTAEAAEWLRSQSGVVEAKADDAALWFRLDGGRPHWVMSEAAFGAIPDEPAPSPIVVPQASAKRAWVQSRAEKDVVGPFPEEKRALVLSPYLWEFKGYDDGEPVAQLLEEAKGYAGNVTYKGNADKLNPEITGSDYAIWDTFDVVHVSTHGAQVCTDGNCTSVLYQGVMTTGGGEGALIGVVVATAPDDDDDGDVAREHYAATEDFFRSQYPNGLSETIVVFSACQSTKGPGFADLFANPSSVFFGWSETVGAPVAFADSIALYGDLINTGRRTEKVYEELLDVGAFRDTNGALLQRFQGEDDLRIRELITAYDPSSTPSEQTILRDGDILTINGAPGDGMPDTMPFLIDVDGVEEDELADFVVHVSVNGTEAKRTWTLEGAGKVDSYSYRLEAEAEFDVDFDGSAGLDVQFWVELPEGGESRLMLDLDLAAWRMTFGGPFLAGNYAGSFSELTVRSGALLQLDTGEVEDTVAVVFSGEIGGPIQDGTSSYSLRWNGSASDSTISFFDPNLAPPDSFLLDVVNGDGVSTVTLPDNSEFIHPAPATLTLFDYDRASPVARGQIEGTYFTCYGAEGPGSNGDCDTFSVQLDFTATNDAISLPATASAKP